MESQEPRRVQQALREARETLERTRARDELEFRERPAEVPGAPGRSAKRPLASPDRISPSPPPAPPPPAPPLDTQPPTWADERAAVLESIRTWEEERAPVLEAIRGLRELCEALSDQLAELRWRQLGTQFDTPHAAFRELNRWKHEERARIEAARPERRVSEKPDARSRDNQEQEPSDARGKYSRRGRGRTERDCGAGYTVEPTSSLPDACEDFAKIIYRVP